MKTIRYGPEMRILIVGGGIGGLTLAGLLWQRGFRPIIVEKSAGYADAGYVLGLFPAGSRVLKGLGLFPAFQQEGEPLSRYEVANSRGRRLQLYHFDTISEKYGPTISISRINLIDVLRRAVPLECLRLGTTVQALTQTPEEVRATLSDGNIEMFDLVVGCDGLHSQTRRLIFGDVPLTYLGLTGWGFWIPADMVQPDQVTEYWGVGKFFGIYPAQGRCCVFTGVKLPPKTPDPVETRVARIREHFAGFGGLVPTILSSLGHPEEMFHDDYSDVKTKQWHTGRVVLIGDAAHAILPTGGAGASLAMESAAVLAEELCRADSRTIDFALEQHVVRRRRRVDRIQWQSRLYGKLMLAGAVGSALRNMVFRYSTDAQLMSFWDNVMSEHL